MNVRTAVASAIGAAGTAVVGNRLLSRRAGNLESSLPGVERTYRWRGMDVAYTEAGNPDDPDVLLCHGIHAAASSDEFEPIAAKLADDHHVVAVDLPGFGRSDRPPLVYSPGIYTEFLRDVATDLVSEPTVIASSLTGAFAAEAAREAPIGRLVLICPTDETGPDRPRLRTLLRTPVVGTTLFNLLASKPSLRYFYARDGYEDPTVLDDGRLAYAWRSAHQPGARYAPASFASGALDPETDLATALAGLEIPVTLVWGREAERVPLQEGRDLADAADCDLVVVDEAKLLPHAEYPETVAEYLVSERPRAGTDR
ncbi:alpha/beta fold hydrolase [Halobacteria archaeon AArc-dxtr1]|nr:alpha/beta fold hydrolase [Halobacteria archaeon AArc-dxtr1]